MKTLGSSIRLAILIAGLFLTVLARPVAATDVSGTIGVNTEWTLAGSPYFVRPPGVTVDGPNTPVLTIDPGVTVKFDANTFLQIGSSHPAGLHAVGTSVSLITFTANTDSPSRGYWQGITLTSWTVSTSQISYATVSYGGGGSGGIGISGCSPTVTNVTAANNAHAGVSISGGGSPSINGLAAMNNSNGILINSGSATITNATVANNAYVGIGISGGSPSVSNSTISGNASGINTSWWGTRPSFQNLTISNNTGFAITQDADETLGTVSGLVLSGNGTNGVLLNGSYVDVNTVWKNIGWPYILPRWVDVDGSNTPILTIEPGVTIKLTQNAYLAVGVTSGGLQAVGTPASPITFTANTSNPLPGYWQGIVLRSGAVSTQISYATVSYGGLIYTHGGISIEGSSPTISNVTVQNNSHSGVSISGWAAPSITASIVSSNPVGIYTWNPATPSLQNLTISSNTGFAISQDAGQTFGAISGLTLSGNGKDAIELREGWIGSNTTWKNTGWPYAATGTIIVDGSNTPTLTIEAGVTIKFTSGRYLQIGFYSASSLQAVGTPSSPITFTASAGSWSGISLTSNTVATRVSYATVSYAAGDGIGISSCSPTISNVTVTNNSHAGVSISGGSPTITAVTAASNGYTGVSITGGSPTITALTATSNAYAGATISGGSPSIAGATISRNPVGIYSSTPATPSLQNLTISANTGFAISLSVDQTLGTVSGLGLSGNGTDGAELRGGNIQTNVTWKNIGWPYVTTGGVVTVYGLNTPVLTVQAGVVVRFAWGGLVIGASSLAQASLQAVGTPASPIIFTASTANPAPGDWQGTVLTPNAVATRIAYAAISYGGYPRYGYGGISITGCSPAISYVTLQNNAYAGISVNGGSPAIVSSSFVSNPAGIVNQSNMPVNAVLNYWGAASGPSGIGPGTGESVSAAVQFNPWLTAPPAPPEYFLSGSDNDLRFNPSSKPAAWSLTASQAGTWALSISDSQHHVVRTITGSGSTFHPTWNGKNDQGALQPDGVYSYTLQATSMQGTAGPAAGNLRIDSQLNVSFASPTDGQTVSNVYANGATDVQVTGTAMMAGLAAWSLEYGAGSAPTSWTLLGSGTQGINNGTFATWATKPLPNQLYTLWLAAWDGAGYYSQVIIGVVVANFSATENALQVSAPAHGTVSYTSIVPLQLTETLTIKNGSGQIVRTLVNRLPRPPGTYTDTWDGKSDSGGFLPDGPYFYFATVTDGTHIFTWDQTNQYYGDWSDVSLSFNLNNWDPFNNTPLTDTYNFSQPGRVNVALKQADGGGCAPPSFCLKQDKYEESGQHTIAWAGVDSTGALRFDLTRLEISSSRAIFSKNAIVLYGTKPSVTNVTVTPAMYGPAVGTQTVAFDLATFQSQNASVTLTFLNQGSLAVLRTITLTGQSPGHKTVPWDGRADNGMWVAPGFYTVTVTVNDSLGNQVQGQILTTIQY